MDEIILGSNRDTVTLTTEQYNAIIARLEAVESKSENSVTLTTEEYNKLKNANIYSTNETEIGRWIDGKKLYRKVFTQTNTNDIDLSSLNYDYIQVSSR